MNILVVWCRVFWGLVWGIGSIREFEEGRLISALFLLSISFMLLIPLLLMARRRQKPQPLFSLGKNFDLYTLTSWLRGIVGFICAIGGFSIILPNNDKLVSALGLFIFGLFLLSPLESKVFTYGEQIPGPTGKRPWQFRMTMLFLIRSTGVLFIMGGLISLPEKDMQTGSIVSIALGLPAVFAWQLKKLFSPKVVEPVARPDGTQVAEASTSPLPPQASEQSAASRPMPAGLPAIDLAKLSGMYKALQSLAPDKKGPAYQHFLNELFSLYDLSARNTFTLQGHEISGSFELEGQVYILAARWQEEKSGHEALLVFNGKIEARSTWARGIFISNAGFTREGLDTFAQGKRTSIIGIDGKDLQVILSGNFSLVDAIKKKARRAVETNHSFVPLSDLI